MLPVLLLTLTPTRPFIRPKTLRPLTRIDASHPTTRLDTPRPPTRPPIHPDVSCPHSRSDASRPTAGSSKAGDHKDCYYFVLRFGVLPFALLGVTIEVSQSISVCASLKVRWILRVVRGMYE